jgi:hypothetical protein
MDFPVTVDCISCGYETTIEERHADRWSRPHSPGPIRVEMVLLDGWRWEWTPDGYRCPDCKE